MTDPVTIGVTVKAIQTLRELAQLLPSGGGVPKLVKDNLARIETARSQQNAPPAATAGGSGVLREVPSGPSAADRMPTQASTGFPIALPFPITLPGRVLSNLPGWGSVLSRVLGPLGALILISPNEAGRGSDLRDLYGIAQPKRPPRAGASGRGRRTRRRPRAVPGRRASPWSGPKPKGRAGPVTISRPRVVAPPAVATAAPPRPRSLPPAVKIDVGKITAPAPAPVRQTVLQRAQAIARNPIVRNVLGTAAAAGLSGLFSSPVPRIGRVAVPGAPPVPGVGPIPSPVPLPAPLTAFNVNPLTYARTWAAPQTAAREQDCSCRPARKKRKSCTNPITSRRTFRRGSAKFRTVTRKLRC